MFLYYDPFEKVKECLSGKVKRRAVKETPLWTFKAMQLDEIKKRHKSDDLSKSEL